MIKRAIIALGVVLASTGSSFADQPVGLANESHVTAMLVEARVADRIRKECTSLEGRRMRAISEARQLKAWANRQGYTDGEIRAFLESREQKSRIYALAAARLARNGAILGVPESYCVAGHSEIRSNTLAGSLLK